MSLYLVGIFLIRSFVFRIFGFFHHWYGHTFIILRRIIDRFPSGSASRFCVSILLFFFYCLWSMIPLYLILRFFYEVLL